MKPIPYCTHGSTPIAEWSMALPLTARCFSSLPRFRVHPDACEKVASEL